MKCRIEVDMRQVLGWMMGEAVLGGTHPDVARCLDWLGLHHLLQGNPARAEPLLQRALTIREAALGKNHPEVAQTLNALARLSLLEESYDRSEPLYVRALAIREAALGRNPPEVAGSLTPGGVWPAQCTGALMAP